MMNHPHNNDQFDDITVGTEADNANSMLPIEIEGAEASFPAPEELRSSWTSRNRGSISSLRPLADGATTTKRKKWWLCVGVGTALLILLIIVPSVVVSNKNKSSRSNINAIADASNADKNEIEREKEAAKNRPRPSLESVIAYVVEEQVSDASRFSDTSTPQYQAARWMAETDEANLPVPTTSATLNSYYYKFRYVMALNYYALGGNEWDLRYNFLSADHVCYWHEISTLQGVLCYYVHDGPPIPLELKLGKSVSSFDCCRDSSLNATKSISSLAFLFHSDKYTLGFNNLQGQIPTENGKLGTLVTLQLGENQLTGELPVELCTLSNLWFLLLHDNNITGSIPGCLGDLPLLTLVLHNNSLAGSLPAALADLKVLQTLVMDDNLLTGDPALVFNSLSSLRVLSASNNNFTSDINSYFLANSPFLYLVDLSRNSFFTSAEVVPGHLLSNLVILDMSKNQLAGSFPSDIPKSSNLTFLSLYENELTGPLKSLSNMTALQHLDLSSNNFVGPMDVAIGNLTNLVFLFLSNNPFESGPIPDSFVALNDLNELSLRGTNRTGSLPDFIGRNLTMLRVLDLGSNALTGQIPASYGKLLRLLFLLLNNNPGLTGELPPSFVNMTQLKGAFLDGTQVNEVLDVLCSLPNFKEITGEEVLFADCDVPPPCGTCCSPVDSAGCSRPNLDNLDASWENDFRRQKFSFKNVTGL